MVRTLTAPFAFAARRAAALFAKAGQAQSTNDTFFEQLEDRTVLAADIQAIINATPGTGLASAGGTLTGSIVLTNGGNEAANGFTYRVILSTDSIVGNEDDVIFTNTQQTTSLAAGASLPINLNIFTVPTDVRPGQYFLIVTLDTTNVIAEGEAGEANNTVRSATPFLTLNGPAANSPNLTATINFPSRTVNPEQQFTIPTIIRNTGTAGAGTFHVTWVLSANNIIGDADDIAIDEEEFVSLAAGGQIEINRLITLPVGIDLGSYRIGVWVDDLGDVSESSEANNRVVTPGTVLNVALPELSATFTTSGGTVSPGSFFTGNLTVRNTTAALSAPFTVRIFLSSDNVAGNSDDILLSTVDITSLTDSNVGIFGNGTRTITGLRVYVPFATSGGTIEPGAYRVVVSVDPSNEVEEVNEGNNRTITANPVVTLPARNTANDPVGPDLTTFVYPVTGSFQPGQTINVAAIIANTGSATAVGANVRAYFSSDATFDGGDILLDDDVFDDDDLPTGSRYANYAFTVPGGATNGAGFIIFRVDPQNTVEETNEENNTAAAAAGTVTRSTVSITTTDANAAEVTTGTPNGGVFRIARTGSTASALVVNYTVSGTASAGDYNSVAFTGSVTIPAGQSFVLLNLSVVDDALAESDETVVLTLDTDDFYTVNPASSTATVTIADNETRISVTATDSLAAEVTTGTPNPGVFRVVRTGSTASQLVVTFTIAGSASTDDFTVTGTGVTFDAEERTGTITLPAGAAFGTVTINVVNDALAEPTETVRINIDPTDDYSVSATQDSAVVNIADNEPVITVTASDSAAAETPANNNGGAFRISRVGTVGAIEVFFTISGTTDLTGDYTLSSPLAGATLDYDPVSGTGSIVIPAGSSFATLNVNVIDDSLAEPTETVIITIDAANTYNLAANVAQRSATVNIVDNEPIVTITGVDRVAAETFGTQPANGAVFRVNRPAGNTAGDLVVTYTVSGTATSGDDFVPLSGSVTILAGQTSALINLTVINDALVEPLETVILTLNEGATYRLSPTVSQRSASATIADNEPVVSIQATDAIAGEVVSGSPVNLGNFRISRTGDLSQQLTVNVIVSGTASNQDWVDFVGTELVIPAGQAFYDNPVFVIDDALWEGNETIIITLQTGDGYTLTSTVARRTATVTILDNENTVSITARDRTGAEVTTGTQNPASFRIARTGGVNTLQLAVNYSIGGTATNGSDYTLLTGTAIIPAGAAFIDIPITVTDDSVGELTETVILSLTADPSYRLALSAAQRTATVSILDNEPQVRVAALDATAGEVTTGTANGGSWRFTRVGGSNASELVINFTVTGTASLTGDYTISSGAAFTFDDVTGIGSITIPAGAAFATLNLAVIDDLLPEVQETAILTLNSGTGYRVSSTVSQQSATVRINDNEPRFGVIASDASASEPGANGIAGTGNFRITRTLGGAGQITVVRFALTGTAALTGDYTLSSTSPGASLTFDTETGIGTITFTATNSTVNILLTPLGGNNDESTETAILTILNANEGSQGYSINPAQTAATINITNVVVP